MGSIDDIDLRLLTELQRNADLPLEELGNRVGLSRNACWRRVRRLEERGVIRKRVALLSQEQLSLDVTVFVGIRTNEHNDQWLKKFSDGVAAIPEVVEFYRMSGDTDFLVQIAECPFNQLH